MYEKHRAVRAAIIAGLLFLFLIFAISLRPQALTGNIDVDKARPDIDKAIENMKPYEPPTPLERWIEWIVGIIDRWKE